MATEQELERLQSGIDGKIFVEYVDEVAIIRLDCGENRMNRNFLNGLNRCYDEILQRSDIQAVVTVGSGKFFSNGLDLPWLTKVSGVSSDAFAAVIKLWHQTLRRLLLFPLPTIAAINGHAFAGGAMLALCHDYRIMQTDKGWFSVNEVHLQLTIPSWLIKLITFKVPGAKAQSDVLLFGKKLVAKDALDLGVVQKITTSKDLLNDAITLVRGAYKGIPGLPREMLQTMKEDTFVEILKLHDDNVHALAKL
jgi:Delta3-Delta2-enoyl-CoA isomerase